MIPSPQTSVAGSLAAEMPVGRIALFAGIQADVAASRGGIADDAMKHHRVVLVVVTSDPDIVRTGAANDAHGACARSTSRSSRRCRRNVRTIPAHRPVVVRAASPQGAEALGKRARETPGCSIEVPQVRSWVNICERPDVVARCSPNIVIDIAGFGQTESGGRSNASSHCMPVQWSMNDRVTCPSAALPPPRRRSWRQPRWWSSCRRSSACDPSRRIRPSAGRSGESLSGK